MYNVGACRRGVLNVQCRGMGPTMYNVGAWGPQCTMQGCFRIYITYDLVRDMKLHCLNTYQRYNRGVTVMDIVWDNAINYYMLYDVYCAIIMKHHDCDNTNCCKTTKVNFKLSLITKEPCSR